MDIRNLIDKTQEYLPSRTLALIEEAYEFAFEAHKGQVRMSGEPYLEHPLSTAIILADLRLDASSIAAALLHDVPEDCGVPISEIEARFGAEVAKLVDGVTKLGKLPLPTEVKKGEPQAENLRKMLIAMAEDVRVVLIKLADRLHNMRTLGALPPQKRQDIAQETMEIYAPLAHRLGIFEMKWQLEDLSFCYLEPKKYQQLARFVSVQRTQRESYINEVSSILEEELRRAGIKAEVTGRPKHIYSIYQKTERYASQGRDLDDIHDLFALRVVVNEVSDCYSALGVIHSLWHPLFGEFDDYIANPKDSGYRSIHTTVMCLGYPIEMQIRTYEMHRYAEYGIAAHWRYKEGAKEDLHFEERIAWLRQLIEWQREIGAEEFLESTKTDILSDQVFVYTPKGEVKNLPTGSTPIDFAYRIHTDLGHNCVGAKVNGRLISLNYQLRNGDTVQILTTKAGKGPSRDWLNPHLGYIKTSTARTRIRQWFRKRERGENIERGKELLDKELRRFNIKVSEEEIARLFNYDDLGDFLAALGYGEISPYQIGVKLAREEPPHLTPRIPTRPRPSSSAIQVLGVGDLLTNIAQCCNPVPGDEIIGYITRSRGVMVHRKDCPNILNEDEKERLVRVEWGQIDQLYPVPIIIEAWDRVGLLRDIGTAVAEEKVNIASVNANDHDDHTITIHMTLETKGIAQLSRLFPKLEGVKGIISVSRDAG